MSASVFPAFLSVRWVGRLLVSVVYSSHTPLILVNVDTFGLVLFASMSSKGSLHMLFEYRSFEYFLHIRSRFSFFAHVR